VHAAFVPEVREVRPESAVALRREREVVGLGKLEQRDRAKLAAPRVTSWSF
jgi:hypothetical protein